MAAVCVCAPRRRFAPAFLLAYAVSVALVPLLFFPLLPSPSSLLVHFLCMSGDMLSCKDATSAHRAETFRPPCRTNLSDVHCYDERRNFPVGMDNIFRENIGNFLLERRRDKFPLFLYRGKKRISFPSNERELILNLFQPRKSIHCFFFSCSMYS